MFSSRFDDFAVCEDMNPDQLATMFLPRQPADWLAQDGIYQGDRQGDLEGPADRFVGLPAWTTLGEVYRTDPKAAVIFDWPYLAIKDKPVVHNCSSMSDSVEGNSTHDGSHDGSSWEYLLRSLRTPVERRLA